MEEKGKEWKGGGSLGKEVKVRGKWEAPPPLRGERGDKMTS